jgi:hypothetical protein
MVTGSKNRKKSEIMKKEREFMECVKQYYLRANYPREKVISSEIENQACFY